MGGRKKWFGGMAATGSMLLGLSLLVLGVMRLPQLYGNYNDERTLNRPEYAENEVSVYSYDYTSVTEKIKDILYYGDKGDLASMDLPPAGDAQVSDEQLREILQDELDWMYDAGILLRRVELAGYVYEYRQMRSLYPTNGDRLKGQISYWVIGFRRPDKGDDRIVILADAQYHKLYALVVSGTDADSMYYTMQKWLLEGIQGDGKRGAELAAELLDSLSYRFAEYYGGAVPEESEQEAGEAAGGDPEESKSIAQNATAYDAPADEKMYAGNFFQDIYYLENVFYCMIEDNADSGRYLELPVSVSLGEGRLLDILSIYNFLEGTFSITISPLMDYMEG